MFSSSPSIFAGASASPFPFISLSGLSFVASIAAAKLTATRLSVSSRSFNDSSRDLFDCTSLASISSSYLVGAQQRQNRNATTAATQITATRNTKRVQSHTFQTTPLTTNYVVFIPLRLYFNVHISSFTSFNEVVVSLDSVLDFTWDSSNYCFYYPASSPPLCFLFKNACYIMLMPSCMSMSKSTSLVFSY